MDVYWEGWVIFKGKQLSFNIGHKNSIFIKWFYLCDGKYKVLEWMEMVEVLVLRNDDWVIKFGRFHYLMKAANTAHITSLALSLVDSVSRSASSSIFTCWNDKYREVWHLSCIMSAVQPFRRMFYQSSNYTLFYSECPWVSKMMNLGSGK